MSGEASARWEVASKDSRSVTQPIVTQLTQELGIPSAIAEVLSRRGLKSVEEARAFLYPGSAGLYPPEQMLGMSPAVLRLRAALERHEPILIYGDYDVDGTIATVLLKTALERVAMTLGVPSDVRYHIPHRIREGYGIQQTRIEEAASEGVRLIVSVDTGIRAFAAAEDAKRLGLDLIVTDHHLPENDARVPDAIAVLNPNQPDCHYPNKEICGAGVSFKLAQALLESSAKDAEDLQKIKDKLLPSFLKLLAIATIADAVPLTGENRTITSLGLRELRKPSQVGLKSLMELASIDLSRPISASDVGFRLAPRINAAGRMDIASDVVEMFLTREPVLARELAEKLHRLNEDRRATEAAALEEIENRLKTMGETPQGLAACLVLDDEASSGKSETTGWHRGVIGILASRVVDRTGKPALVISHEEGEAYGSGRSVKGFHLLDALTSVHLETSASLFTRFGGHAHAVGFSLPSAKVQELRERMELYAQSHAPSGLPEDSLEYDAELRLGEIGPTFLEWFEMLGPFGNGNPEPVFFSRAVRLLQTPTALKERHLRVQVEDPEDGSRMGGVAWGKRTNWAAKAQAERWMQGDRCDLSYRLRRNWHLDFGGWELEIMDIQVASRRQG